MQVKASIVARWLTFEKNPSINAMTLSTKRERKKCIQLTGSGLQTVPYSRDKWTIRELFLFQIIMPVKADQG